MTRKRKPAPTVILPDGEASPKPKKRGSNRLLYTREIADEICTRVASGETLRQVCRTPGMPHEATVRGWALENHDGFGLRYHQARDMLLETWADEIIEISDDGSNDWMKREGKDGEGSAYAVNNENVQRSKLRADNRKWLLCKLKPATYGERVSAELTGKDGAPLNEPVNLIDLSRWILLTLTQAEEQTGNEKAIADDTD